MISFVPDYRFASYVDSTEEILTKHSNRRANTCPIATGCIKANYREAVAGDTREIWRMTSH